MVVRLLGSDWSVIFGVLYSVWVPYVSVCAVLVFLSCPCFVPGRPAGVLGPVSVSVGLPLVCVCSVYRCWMGACTGAGVCVVACCLARFCRAWSFPLWSLELLLDVMG